MNRPDISRLKKNRSIFLKIGFLTSISLVIMAFNVTVYEYENQDYSTIIEDDQIFEKIVRTHQDEQKKLPPLDMKVSDKFIEDTHEFIEDPLPEPLDTEINIDTQLIRPAVPEVTRERPKTPVIVPEAIVVDEDDMEFIVVEQMPRFPGCEESVMTKEEKKTCADKALLEYIYSKIKYPQMASSNGIEGTVVLDFVVEKNGQITDVKIRKEIGGGCGKEVVRVVNGMPIWIPGKQRDRKVRVRFTMPVQFKLQ